MSVESNKKSHQKITDDRNLQEQLRGGQDVEENLLFGAEIRLIVGLTKKKTLFQKIVWILVSILSLGMLPLFARVLSPSIKRILQYRESSQENATSLLVQDNFGRTTIKKVKKLKLPNDDKYIAPTSITSPDLTQNQESSEKQSLEISPKKKSKKSKDDKVEESGVRSFRMFEFNFLRYYFSSEKSCFTMQHKTCYELLDEFLWNKHSDLRTKTTINPVTGSPETTQTSFFIRGLSSADHRERLIEFGTNHFNIKSKKRLEQWKQLLKQFLSPFFVLNLLMCVALLLFETFTSFVGLQVDFMFVIGFWMCTAVLSVLATHRLRSGKIKNLLAQLLKSQSREVRVIRDGESFIVGSSNLVPGDIIEITNRITLPCDLLLLTGSVEVDESAISGDAMASSKIGYLDKNFNQIFNSSSNASKGSRSNSKTKSSAWKTTPDNKLVGGSRVLSSKPTPLGEKCVINDENRTEEQETEILSCLSEEKRRIHNYFKNFKIFETISNENDGQKNIGKVLAMVIRTGFNSSKGKVIREVLLNNLKHGSFSEHAFFREINLLMWFLIFNGIVFMAFKLFYLLLHFVVMLFPFTVNNLFLPPFIDLDSLLDLRMISWTALTHSAFVFILFNALSSSCYFFFTFVPPFFKLAYAIPLLISRYRLKRANIRSTDFLDLLKFATINAVCFDKTGTMTEGIFRLFGVLEVNMEQSSLLAKKRLGILANLEKRFAAPPENEKENKKEKEQNFNANLSLNGMKRDATLVGNTTLECMTCCHDLRWVNNELFGDELEKSMFSVTNYLMDPNPEKRIFRAPLQFDRGTVQVEQLFSFSSYLRRMSVVTSKPKRRVYCKGAPDAILSICRKETIPRDAKTTIAQFGLKGFRLIAFAKKEVDDILEKRKANNPNAVLTNPKEADIRTLRLERPECESNMDFLGFFVFKNKIHEETFQEIQLLHMLGIRPIMITGDNTYTAISVAKNCFLIGSVQKEKQKHQKSDKKPLINRKRKKSRHDKSILIAETEAKSDYKGRSSSMYSISNMKPMKALDLVQYEEDQVNFDKLDIVWKELRRKPASISYSEEDDICSIVPLTLDSSNKTSFEDELVMNGRAFAIFSKGATKSNKNNFHFSRLLLKTTVFSEMNAMQKAELIFALKKLDYEIAMVGDGSNDTLALTAANVGLSVSSGGDSSNSSSVAAKFSREGKACVAYLILEAQDLLARIRLNITFLVISIFSIISYLIIRQKTSDNTPFPTFSAMDMTFYATIIKNFSSYRNSAFDCPPFFFYFVYFFTEIITKNFQKKIVFPKLDSFQFNYLKTYFQFNFNFRLLELFDSYWRSFWFLPPTQLLLYLVVQLLVITFSSFNSPPKKFSSFSWKEWTKSKNHKKTVARPSNHLIDFESFITIIIHSLLCFLNLFVLFVIIPWVPWIKQLARLPESNACLIRNNLLFLYSQFQQFILALVLNLNIQFSSAYRNVLLIVFMLIYFFALVVLLHPYPTLYSLPTALWWFFNLTYELDSNPQSTKILELQYCILRMLLLGYSFLTFIEHYIIQKVFVTILHGVIFKFCNRHLQIPTIFRRLEKTIKKKSNRVVRGRK